MAKICENFEKFGDYPQDPLKISVVLKMTERRCEVKTAWLSHLLVTHTLLL